METLHKESADSRKKIQWLNLCKVWGVSSLLERCSLGLLLSELPKEFDFSL